MVVTNPLSITYKCIGGQPGTQSCGLALSSWLDSEAGYKAGNLLPYPLHAHVPSAGTYEHGVAALAVVE